MLNQGQQIIVVYDDGDYTATLVNYDSLQQKIKNALFNQLISRQLTFTVRFKEDDEYSYDVITIDQIKSPLNALQYQILGNKVPLVVSNSIFYEISNFFNQHPQTDLVGDILQFQQPYPLFLGSFPTAPTNLSQRFFGNEFICDYCGFVDQNQNLVQLDQFCISMLQPSYLFQLQKIIAYKNLQNETQYLACGVSINNNIEFPVIFPLETVVLSQNSFNVKNLAIIFTELATNLQLDLLLEEEEQLLPTADDLILGLNYQWLDGLQLKKGNQTLSPATPLEILNCSFWFIQGKIIDDNGNIAKLRPQKVNSDANFCYQMQENIEFTYQQPLFAQLIQFLESEKYLSNNRLIIDKVSIQRVLSFVLSYKHIRCGFCGKEIQEHFAGPFLHSLIQTNDVLGQPILIAFHRDCARFVPEVAEFTKNEEVTDSVNINIKYPWEVQYCILDRFFRRNLIVAETEIYQFLRKALKQDRINNKCTICQQFGAVIGCWDSTCAFTAHYYCIMSAGLVFKEEKKIYCKKHMKK
ncbi:PHD-like zinc-binding domain-containing protein [Spironucleus salmonicida]|uniref:PHD-like zinc-binding domain-containing protein n=1 Tax=Spironucleus salmonicida TaxID=348837 RepID=V6LKT5_9EUKA|nr:PHD-like zinc-binding domain-containing protein [Spironucleus salmonicida]|eukprot:EST44978.1 hypothetical protein SS50377_14997 [Spironucleus salmonicida]